MTQFVQLLRSRTMSASFNSAPWRRQECDIHRAEARPSCRIVHRGDHGRGARLFRLGGEHGVAARARPDVVMPPIAGSLWNFSIRQEIETCASNPHYPARQGSRRRSRAHGCPRGAAKRSLRRGAATTWIKLGEEPHWLCAVKNIPNQPQVDSKDNNCRKEANREQNSVFLKIPERDQRDQNGGKDVAKWNWH